MVAILAVAAAGCRRAAAAPPVQPIAFDHSLHARNDISCARCHPGAERHRQAGLVAIEACATCHRRTATDRPAVQQLMKAFEERRPIRWQRINHLPREAMVHFDHGAHARAEVACAHCHGEVAAMTVATAARNTADMGWCVSCHRERGASVDCLTCHY